MSLRITRSPTGEIDQQIFRSRWQIGAFESARRRPLGGCIDSPVSTFHDAVSAFVAGFTDGQEIVVEDYIFNQNIGAVHTRIHTRAFLRRDGSHVLQLRASHPANEPEGALEETGRWAMQDLPDFLLDNTHVGRVIGLPAPAEDEIIERALVRLRQGKIFTSGGTDYRGGESFGGMGELRSEGEGFVLHSETWHNGTTDRSDQRMNEAELRAALASDNQVRGLLGLSSK